MNVLLIGLRGSGKSSVAQLVAKSTDLVAVDLDFLTAAHLSSPTAAAALTTHGQTAFREAEIAVLAEVLTLDNQVIAAGGGTPTAPGAAQLIAASSIASDLRVFYLRATPQTLHNRLKLTDLSTRPSLTGMGVLEEIETLFKHRDSLYSTLADHIITVESKSIEESAQLILASLNA